MAGREEGFGDVIGENVSNGSLVWADIHYSLVTHTGVKGAGEWAPDKTQLAGLRADTTSLESNLILVIKITFF